METTKKQKMAQKRHLATDIDRDSDSDCEEATPQASAVWPRFLIVHSKVQEKPVCKLHPFLVGETLRSRVGRPDAQRLRSGDLLVECRTRAHSNGLLRLSSIGDTPVEVTPHKTMNSSRGVIQDQALAELSEEELVRNLKSQGVTYVRRFASKRGGGEIRLPTIILTFGTPTPPTTIWGGYYSLKVKKYVPLPLRCFKCQKYGHGQKTCRQAEASCARCTKPGHSAESCTATPLCVNCQGAHMASDRKCPRWISECRIQQVRVEKGLSFADAKKLVEGPGAAVAASNSSNTSVFTFSAAVAGKRPTQDFCCQTPTSWLGEEPRILSPLESNPPPVVTRDQGTQKAETPSPVVPPLAAPKPQPPPKPVSSPVTKASGSGQPSKAANSSGRNAAQGQKAKKPMGPPCARVQKGDTGVLLQNKFAALEEQMEVVEVVVAGAAAAPLPSSPKNQRRPGSRPPSVSSTPSKGKEKGGSHSSPPHKT
jgi:hypothetical protein